MAQAYPARPALIAVDPAGDDRSLSYEALSRLAGAYRAQLALRGVGPGTHVLVPTGADPRVIASYLACSALRAAYVPVNLSWPRARVKEMADDAAAPVAVEFEPRSLEPYALGVETLRVAGHESHDPLPPREEPSAEDIAYVMYTSGSTGRPKGVSVPNRGILRLVTGADFMTLDENTRFAQISAQTFDAATLEIWAPLLNGGCCVLIPSGELPDLDRVRTAIEEHGINAMWMTASLFNFVVDNAVDLLKPLSFVLTGGEALSVAHVVKANSALPNTQLINGYGPTENTTFTTCYVIPKDFPGDAESVPIGRAISGTTVRVEPVEGGEHGAGELIAEGLGLARGYLGRPDETARRFVFDPSDPSRAIAYRTGDLVRELDDGLFEFAGRVDEQVKINGHRIEPGEVDAVALTLPGVSQIRTLVRQAGATKKLVAYYVGTVETDSLRRSLRELLPEYMVPSHLVAVASLPFTENHKLDVSRLPDPFASRVVDLAPRKTLIDEISGIWRNAVPGISDFGPDDNFFDVGGSSVEALEVVKQCEALVGREVSAVKAFEFPTVRALARYLELGAIDTKQQAKSRAEKSRAARKKKRARR